MSIPSQLLPAKRILVIRYRFIGDTILTVPFLKNLRAAYPHAQIDVLVGPTSGQVLEGCPYVDNLIVFDTTSFHKYDRGAQKKRHFLSYAWEVRKRSYDLVFALKRSFSSGLLAWLSGAKYRVGYATQGRNWLLTHPVEWNQHIHEVESTLDVLKAAGVTIVNNQLESWISPEETQAIQQIVPELCQDRPRILIHAAAAHPDKLYPIEHWAKIIQKLHTEHNALPFFTGDAQDYQLYEQLQRLSGVQGVNLAGKLSLRQSMALYKQLSMAVCVDSGPAHLAAASGIPTIALFGPTDPVRWRPWGSQHQALFDDTLSCRPCHYKKVCEDRPCLTQLSPDVILDRCFVLLAGNQSTYARS